MDEELIYAKGVVDKEAYKRLQHYVKLLDEYPEKVMLLKCDAKIDCSATITRLNEYIKKYNIEGDELNEMWRRYKMCRSWISSIAYNKKKSFGVDSTTQTTYGLGPAIEREAEIVDLFGRFYKAEEVTKILKEEWGYDVSPYLLKNFYKKNIAKIEELRKEYESSYSDIRLGKKRSRLEELTWLYHRIKDKYIKNEIREDAKLLMAMLEQIKKECEGDLVINGKLQVDIEHTIHIQMQQNMLKDFNITALIIAKVAGRLDINALMILSRLARSNYAKFTGFAKATKEQMQNDDIYYASGISYDFDNIQKLGVDQAQKDIILKALPQIAEGESKMSIKEIMLERIKQKQSILNSNPKPDVKRDEE